MAVRGTGRGNLRVVLQEFTRNLLISALGIAHDVFYVVLCLIAVASVQTFAEILSPLAHGWAVWALEFAHELAVVGGGFIIVVRQLRTLMKF